MSHVDDSDEKGDPHHPHHADGSRSLHFPKATVCSFIFGGANANQLTAVSN